MNDLDLIQQLILIRTEIQKDRIYISVDMINQLIQRIEKIDVERHELERKYKKSLKY
jgi:hypothetical protein